MARCNWRSICTVVRRKLVYEQDEAENSNLRRCLGRWDLTSLGLGSTLGVGVYVLIGGVALRFAGPSIVLSFLIAAVASMFAGLCFAEFGARVPRAGSAYVYTYVTIGELVAFIIGWNVILEGLFGTASVAKGLSVYIDSMSDGAVSAWFKSIFPMHVDFFSNYFDMLSFCLVLILGLLLAFGARESALVNNGFSILNMMIILFVIIAGSFTAKVSNWDISASEVPAGFGTGGFFPYGVWGTLKGASLCFYGFTGFDAISATGEEVRDPRHTIPQAIIIVLCVVFIVYASVSTVITMMVPYYLLDKVAATALSFRYVGWEWARWVVSAGACAGIFASLFGSMFPVTRLLYAMASDGLLVHWFAYVSDSRKTPVFSTLVATFVISIVSATMELEDLILMMAVGTLCSYTIVATCVIILRYHSEYMSEIRNSYVKQILGFGDKQASRCSMRVVNVAVSLYILVSVAIAILAVHVNNSIIAVVVLNVIALLLLIVITLQPQAIETLQFKTPLVPVIPCLSIYVNIHLMILVNIKTWLRVLCWLGIGIPVYFLSVCCFKRPERNFGGVDKSQLDHRNKNGSPHVQIIVESPTPPDTLSKRNIGGDHSKTNEGEEIQMNDNVFKRPTIPFKSDEIIIQQAVIENNFEKEAKIIDLLDQVLQAEEDSYVEVISFKEEIPKQEIMTPIETTESIPHTKSLSELSDAGSDASLSTQDTKYNVIAQVHREDLSKVSEEEERTENDLERTDPEAVNDAINDNVDDHEPVTSFDDSETNSRTDESGYSDTLDKNILNDSVEEVDTIEEDAPHIPTPPPMDETYFSSPYIFRKANTISARPKKQNSVVEDNEEENKPRESVQSNTSHGTDDGNIIFGSTRQMKFMNKLNNIFQHKIASDGEGPPEEPRKRSNSTGDVSNIELPSPQMMRERASLFLDLKKELAAISVPNLRPVRNEDGEKLNNTEPIITNDEDVTTEDSSMSREDLKTKLETIFATGGPKLLKPRLMKSNPPTPEEAYQTDTSSTESIPKLPKMEKNDTLKRQKDKFGEVLKSFRLSLNKEDMV